MLRETTSSDWNGLHRYGSSPVWIRDAIVAQMTPIARSKVRSEYFGARNDSEGEQGDSDREERTSVADRNKTHAHSKRMTIGTQRLKGDWPLSPIL